MKAALVCTLSVLLILAGCSGSKETANHPVENLFSYANADELGNALGDTLLKSRITLHEWTPLLEMSKLRVDAMWVDINKPVARIRLQNYARNLLPNTISNLPDTWRTRDGVYAWIMLDSLQAINGKPFYLEYDGSRFQVVNWEEGILAKSNIDMTMILEFSGPTERLMSSQMIIDRKLKVRGFEMVVWNAGWPMANRPASNGIAGDYPQGSLRELTEIEIRFLSIHGLQYMRNEIFARHGYMFNNEELKSYFGSKSWYKPRFTDVVDKLTDIEKKNIELIVKCEEKLYLKRPITAMMRELPLLTLPINFESNFAEGISIPVDIENPDGEIEAEFASSIGGEELLYGILPDTSQYYAVVWRSIGPGMYGGYSTEIRITTFDKKFRRIDGNAITVSYYNGRHSMGDCNATESYTSALNNDLTFNSKYEVTLNCPPGEEDGSESTNTEDPTTTAIVSGKIGSTGKVVSNFKGSYFFN